MFFVGVDGSRSLEIGCFVLEMLPVRHEGITQHLLQLFPLVMGLIVAVPTTLQKLYQL